MGEKQKLIEVDEELMKKLRGDGDDKYINNLQRLPDRHTGRSLGASGLHRNLICSVARLKMILPNAKICYRRDDTHQVAPVTGRTGRHRPDNILHTRR